MSNSFPWGKPPFRPCHAYELKNIDKPVFSVEDALAGMLRVSQLATMMEMP